MDSLAAQEKTTRATIEKLEVELKQARASTLKVQKGKITKAGRCQLINMDLDSANNVLCNILAARRKAVAAERAAGMTR